MVTELVGFPCLRDKMLVVGLRYISFYRVKGISMHSYFLKSFCFFIWGWILNFTKAFVAYMEIILWFFLLWWVNVLYYINRFPSISPLLHSYYKLHDLVMVYHFLNVAFESAWWYFILLKILWIFVILVFYYFILCTIFINLGYQCQPASPNL